MSLLIKEDTENILGRKYNVEYKVNNDSIHTFSNVLTNVDGTYFWFSSLEDGLDIIRQDRIVTMICLERNKKLNNMSEDAPYASNREVYCNDCGCQTDKNNRSIIRGEEIFYCQDCYDYNKMNSGKS